jgi:hypothetical protein
MELDDLRQRWMEHDRRLDEALRLNRRLLLTADLGKTKSAMQRLRAAIAAGIGLDVLILVALGRFIGEHLSEPRFLVPALTLHLAALGTLISGIVQWMRAGTLNYDAPVVELQRRFESLRVLRIRTTQAELLLAGVLWPPLLIVGLRWGFGVDAYALLGTGYLIVNLVFGLALALGVVWVCRRFEARLSRSPLVRSIARDIAGKSLTRAMEQLERLAAFEREEGRV